MLPAAFTVLFLLIVVAALFGWIIIRQGKTDDTVKGLVKESSDNAARIDQVRDRWQTTDNGLRNHIVWHRARGDKSESSTETPT